MAGAPEGLKRRVSGPVRRRDGRPPRLLFFNKGFYNVMKSG